MNIPSTILTTSDLQCIGIAFTYEQVYDIFKNNQNISYVVCVDVPKSIICTNCVDAYMFFNRE